MVGKAGDPTPLLQTPLWLTMVDPGQVAFGTVVELRGAGFEAVLDATLLVPGGLGLAGCQVDSGGRYDEQAEDHGFSRVPYSVAHHHRGALPTPTALAEMGKKAPPARSAGSMLMMVVGDI